MRRAPIFTLYCLAVLSFYTLARFQNWTLFASSGRAVAAAAGGPRASGGSSGFHK